MECSDFCSVSLVNGGLFHWEAVIIGPKGSTYEDGLYRLDIKFSNDYPNTKPTFTFMTKIYHPNINSKGNICTNLLNQWNSEYSICDEVNIICNLLANPNPKSPWPDEVWSECVYLMKNNHSKYMIIAKHGQIFMYENKDTIIAKEI